MVEIMKKKYDQDLFLNLGYFAIKMNSTLGSVVPLAMFKDTFHGDWTYVSLLVLFVLQV